MASLTVIIGEIKLKERAYKAALKRGLYKGVNKKDIILEQLKHIKKEVKEAEQALDNFLEHRYTINSKDCFEKEIADISLICDSLSFALDIDLDKHKMEKLIYNEKRND